MPLVASTMAIDFKFNGFILNKIELSASCLNLICRFFVRIPMLYTKKG